MKHLIKLLLPLLLIFTVNAVAQEEYKNYPGYVDFGDLSGYEAGDEYTEVIIEANLLKMVSSFTKSQDPDLANFLQGIKLVKVFTFSTDNFSTKDILNKMEKIDKDLKAKKWDRIVKVKGSDDNAYVYIKTTPDGSIDGLAVTSMERSGEAAFVNIVGRIDLSLIGKLGDKFDIPSLDNINKKGKE